MASECSNESMRGPRKFCQGGSRSKDLTFFKSFDGVFCFYFCFSFLSLDFKKSHPLNEQSGPLLAGQW